MNEPRPEGHTLRALTPKVTRAWYVACLSSELRDRPLSRVIWDLPIVLFRGAGGVGALVDRCPHRSVPLSFGSVAGGALQCGYHGWRFLPDGACVDVPCLVGEPDVPARRARALPVLERQGMVWVWSDPDHPPEGEPYRFPCADDPAYVTVRKEVAAPGSLHSVVENALDVPHTAFLHAGLFRTAGGPKNELRCVVTRTHDRVQCEYVGEPRPEGLAARILSPSGGVVTHFDRFILPSITEVEYRIGAENHVVLNGACTPVSAFETRLYAVVSVRSRLPRWLVRPLVQPIALRIFAQDARVLALQTGTLRRFDDASYVSTELDVLGGHILRLLHRASRGELDPTEAPYVRESVMRV